jgi:hypothetical protein
MGLSRWLGLKEQGFLTALLRKKGVQALAARQVMAQAIEWVTDQMLAMGKVRTQAPAMGRGMVQVLAKATVAEFPQF